MSKMKYSGIEWIGNIPKKWEIKSLKNVCSGFNNGCSNEQLQFGISCFPVITFPSDRMVSVSFIHFLKT